MCEMKDRTYMVCSCDPENPVIRLNFDTLAELCNNAEYDAFGIPDSCTLERKECTAENCPLIEVG